MAYRMREKMKIDNKGFWWISSKDIVGSIDYKKQRDAFIKAKKS